MWEGISAIKIIVKKVQLYLTLKYVSESISFTIPLLVVSLVIGTIRNLFDGTPLQIFVHIFKVDCKKHVLG